MPEGTEFSTPETLPDSRGIADWSKATVELTGLGRHAIRRVKGMAQPGDSVLRLRITLLESSDPSLWREVIIPASCTLDRVHRVIQENPMGWQDCHLHDFRIADREYGTPDPDYGFDTLDEPPRWQRTRRPRRCSPASTSAGSNSSTSMRGCRSPWPGRRQRMRDG